MKHRLLFICTHNRCRSILAEAITHNLAGSVIDVASAGSQPAGEVHPLSLKFLSERNISTTRLRSQSWNDFESFAPTIVLTMCDQAAKESCPTWFSDSKRVHWGLADPSKVAGSAAQVRAAFDQTIDIIESRVKKMLNLNLNDIGTEELAPQLVRLAA